MANQTEGSQCHIIPSFIAYHQANFHNSTVFLQNYSTFPSWNYSKLGLHVEEMMAAILQMVVLRVRSYLSYETWCMCTICGRIQMLKQKKTEKATTKVNIISFTKARFIAGFFCIWFPFFCTDVNVNVSTPCIFYIIRQQFMLFSESPHCFLWNNTVSYFTTPYLNYSCPFRLLVSLQHSIYPLRFKRQNHLMSNSGPDCREHKVTVILCIISRSFACCSIYIREHCVKIRYRSQIKQEQKVNMKKCYFYILKVPHKQLSFCYIYSYLGSPIRKYFYEVADQSGQQILAWGKDEVSWSSLAQSTAPDVWRQYCSLSYNAAESCLGFGDMNHLPCSVGTCGAEM